MHWVTVYGIIATIFRNSRHVSGFMEYAFAYVYPRVLMCG